MRNPWRQGLPWAPTLALVIACGEGRSHSLGSHDFPQEAGAGQGGEGATNEGGPPDFDCAPNPVDHELYALGTNAGGMSIWARAEVDPKALQVACEGVRFVLGERPDLLGTMVENSARMVIVGQAATIDEVPELASLADEVATYRSYGAARERPVMVIAEENLLCLPEDPYEGESLFVHALAHTIRALGIEPSDSAFSARLSALYDTALAEGRWSETFAATSPEQYFAEGTQSFFGVNAEATPADGVHNEVDTPEELREHDLALYELLEGYFDSSITFPLCPP